MNYDNKNFVLAIVLSMAIIFGWQYFYAGPIAERQAKEQAAQQTTTAPATTSAGTTTAGGQVPGMAQPASATRDEALKANSTHTNQDRLHRRFDQSAGRPD